MTKAEAAELYAGCKGIAKRGPPTLPAILKFAKVMTLLRPDVEEIDSIRVMAGAKAEHITNPATGQDILKSPDAVNAEIYDALRTPATLAALPFTFSVKDLPKLPEPSDDPEKAKKALEARSELASEVAQLGRFFVYEDEA